MTHPRTLFGVVITGITLIVVLSGCLATSTTAADPPHPSPFKHVHGLALSDDASFGFAATHAGLYRFPLTGTAPMTPVQVGEPQGGVRDDFMGLTSFDGALLASGHPLVVSDPPGANLGLRQSTDAGVNWKSVSATSTADYHALTVGKDAGGRTVIYGLDSGSSTISSSVDGGRNWTNGAALAARDITADPAVPGTVYATTQSGVKISRDSGQSFDPLADTPALYFLEAVPNQSGATLVGIDIAGSVWAKITAQPWKKTGSIAGRAQAIALTATTDPVILVSDESGIATSRDFGATWRVVITP